MTTSTSLTRTYGHMLPNVNIHSMKSEVRILCQIYGNRSAHKASQDKTATLLMVLWDIKGAAWYGVFIVSDLQAGSANRLRYVRKILDIFKHNVGVCDGM